MPKKPADQSGTPNTARPRAPRKPKSNGASLPTSSDPSYDQIAEAAYHRFLQRGGAPGDDFSDWVEAERELKSRRT